MTPDRTKEVRDLVYQELHKTGQLLSLNELARLLKLQAESCAPRHIREAMRHDRRIGRLRIPSGLCFGHDHVYYAHTNPFAEALAKNCLFYTSPSPRDGLLSRMPSSA